MTRLLAELLGHGGVDFRLGLQQLERSAGRPGHDIRLTAELVQASKTKLHELGLDKHDTTGQELYAALRERLQGDEARLSARLRGTDTSTDDPSVSISRTLQQVLADQQCFALKNSSARKLLKAYPPKRTMKLLGYRSLDSMLKHESVAQLYAAAWLAETEVWSKRVLAAYTKLRQVDFETRPIQIEHPSSKRWQTLSDTLVARQKHHVLSFKELGTVVLLPLPEARPKYVTVTTMVLALHAVNAIRAASTFLKLHQMDSSFGPIVRQVVLQEPMLTARMLDAPVSWHVAQRYYATAAGQAAARLFEPVVHAEDLAWHSVESVLARIEPSLAFWQGTEHVAHKHGQDVVSCNLGDVVLAFCNQLPYASRLSHNFQHALRTELILRYLRHEQLEQAVLGELHRNIAPEPTLA
ncbi:MAG TPA: hypothetical protein VK983_00860 [Candidatus Limnocylindrales bacterium]|nr:hypothetical protein [Candidatus Limnocylindrales bacterium]